MTHVILQTAYLEHGTQTTVVPRGKTHPTLESAQKALAGYQDESGRVRHVIGRVEIVSEGEKR